MEGILMLVGLMAVIVVAILVAELWKLRLYRTNVYHREMKITVDDLTGQMVKELTELLPTIEKEIEKAYNKVEDDE